MSTPVPGWYADPAGTPQLRWWDGTQWTQQYRPANSEQASPNAQANAAPASQVAVQGPASQVAVQGPATAQGAASGYTPVAAKPRTKATGGQIAIAVLSSVLVIVFGVTALLSAGLFIQKGRDYQRVESDLQQAQQELEQAKEGSK